MPRCALGPIGCVGGASSSVSGRVGHHEDVPTRWLPGWNRSADQWYYCLLDHAVEPAEGCKAAERLGPYPTREQAEAALRLAKERNQEWEDDPRFNEEDADDKGGSAFDAFR